MFNMSHLVTDLSPSSVLEEILFESEVKAERTQAKNIFQKDERAALPGTSTSEYM